MPLVAAGLSGVSSMSLEWFYKHGALVVGPVSTEEFRSRASSGGIRHDTLVRQGLTGKWVEARTIRELFAEPVQFDEVAEIAVAPLDLQAAAASVAGSKAVPTEPQGTPTAENLKRIENRMASLARENVVWRWVCAGLLVGLMATIAWAQRDNDGGTTPPRDLRANIDPRPQLQELIRARRIELQNDAGEVLSLTPSGLTLSEGKPQGAGAVVGKSMTINPLLGIRMRDGDQQTVQIAPDVGGGGMIVLSSTVEANKSSAHLSSVFGLDLSDNHGNTQVLMRNSDSGGLIVVKSESKDDKSAVVVNKSGIGVSNRNGIEVASIEDAGGGSITLTDGRAQLNPEDVKRRLANKELTAAERKEISEKGRGAPLVTIGSSEGGGGIIEVFNPLRKRIASLQCSKANKGMLSVGDVNGQNETFVTPER
jgi:hypothetical protein